MNKKKKVVALIPTRLNSLRLPAKALLPINKYPLIIHVYKRAMLSKKIDKVFICCDHKKIFDVAKKYGANVIMTSKKHRNGTDRISEAYNKIREKFQLIVAGGVAANESIRNNLSNLSKEMNFKTVYPDLKFCGDNAAMIAWAGIQRFKKNLIDNINVSAQSRWPLDKDAPYMKGPGLKL